MAASVAGVVGRNRSCSSWIQFKNSEKKHKRVNRVKIYCSSSSAMDPYKTLRIQPGASESEVKKAYRQLALQFHPDVCRGTNCGIQFHQINEAYDIVMENLRGAENGTEMYGGGGDGGEDGGNDKSMRRRNTPDWDLWEEWMGWEGAGIRDYSSHINPYI